MSKLYVFGIGGTGARVIKSLTMLLASGVRLEGTDTVVPVMIDADQSNGDLTRTVELLTNYRNIRSRLSFDDGNKSRFFNTEIDDFGSNFRLPISNEVNKTFGDYIHFNQLDEHNKALISLLFSKRNLKAEMNVGFKGNPNMGSVVLNNFNNEGSGSVSLKRLLLNFQQDDKIFIISSIFGGTGAAGFPLLLKTFRSASSDDFQAAAFLRQARIGAITVLPYFGVEDREGSSINMDTFLSKTKSALTYYINNLDVDVLYYIGDNLKSKYENCEGGRYQENNAHFVELAAALSVVDFVNAPVSGGKEFKEYAIKKDADPILLPHLSDQTQKVMREPLTQFFLFCEFYKHRLKKSLTYAWAKDKHFQPQMLGQDFYKSLGSFFDAFLEWLNEMAHNLRSFQPYNLRLATENPLMAIGGVTPADSGLLGRMFGRDSGYFALLDEMEKAAVKMPSSMTAENYFMNVFSVATHHLIINKKL